MCLASPPDRKNDPTSPREGRGEVSLPLRLEIGWRNPARFAKIADMRSSAENIIHSCPSDIAGRVDAIDWAHATSELDTQGCAVLNNLLSADECRARAALYPDDGHCRSGLVIGRQW